MSQKYEKKAESYVTTLCGAVPNRRTGSEGNREAVRFAAEVMEKYGYSIDTTPFETFDYRSGPGLRRLYPDLFRSARRVKR